MDAARYYVALLLVIAHPPRICLWLVIHPFASFWRRLGTARTYAILAIPVLIYASGVGVLRRDLLSVQFGTSYAALALAAISLAAAIALSVKRRRQLHFGALSGLPELSAHLYPGTLLTAGVYSRIRHPRYVEATLWALAYALFANHLASYVVVLLGMPLIFLVVLLEERELLVRFGAAYQEYARRVPRFLPRRWDRRGDGP